MKFAYHATMCPPDQYLPLTQAAEAAGFDTFTFPDSICYPQFSDSRYPYTDDGSRQFLEDVPFLEPFTLIPALADAGAHVTMLQRSPTWIFPAPNRNPVTSRLLIRSVTLETCKRWLFMKAPFPRWTVKHSSSRGSYTTPNSSRP